MRIVVSGGGTAGHISPILAVLEELKRLDKNLEVLFIGSGGPMEQKILAGAGIEYVRIPAGKFRRYGRKFYEAAIDARTNWKNFKDFFKFNGGVFRAYQLVRKYKPDVVFVKGSYVGLPVGLAAKWLKIPLVLHDSDTVLGMTNKILSKSAKTVATGFPIEFYREYGLKNLVFTGNPLRRSAIEGSKQEARLHFEIKEQKPNVLIFGGSLGAQNVNHTVFDHMEQFARRYNVVHVVGEAEIERARFLASKLPKELETSYRPYSFLKQEMGLAYSLADVVVSRGGANSLAELMHWAKPAIVVPLPTAANNEQTKNAQYLARAGAVRVLPEKGLTGMRLLNEIEKLFAAPKDMRYLSATIHKYAKPDAAKELAEIIFSSGQKS